MPFSILKNPFEKAKKRSKDDAKLVGEFLGPEEEAEMREAMGNQPIVEEPKGDDSVRLSEKEEVEKNKVEDEVMPEQRRQEYIKWAAEIEMDEGWVDETFTFNDNGSVEVEKDLSLSGTNITILPKELTNIGGKLLLTGCARIKDIPEGIKIGDGIILDIYQKELKANAEARGYKVYAW